ncbi:signal peptidase II [Holzapfeliella floricola]|uniref:Lipoprotein signal peptidase n=1 Tax=Holzapfeliella floricola DSM 23037 = JCM 16512 TaxID=1423744 RepID=A0A0R2DHY9_9LACO|nr:signal peptidase II [Holzapfeliella floricola]KRN03712.1 signal peptidase II [Holzapfeliella floricola DSM 23037 = JCM 16512]
MILFWLIGLVMLILDQLLKLYIATNFQLGQVQEVVPNILSFTYVQNTGGASNIFSGNMLFFYIISIIAIPVLLYLIHRTKKRHFTCQLGLILILSGTIGNLIDRIRLQYVVDMFQLDFMRFNIFNVADIAVTCGVALIIIYLLFLDGKDHEQN